MILKIATDFSKAPGPRFRKDGPNSAQEFRERVLVPAVRQAIATQVKLTIDLDGTYGLASSFLDEAFAGLIIAENIRLSDIKSVMNLVSTEEPELVDRIEEYLQWAGRFREAARIPGSTADFVAMESLNGPLIGSLAVPESILNSSSADSNYPAAKAQDHLHI